jgi:hypothetical protein
VEIGVDVLGHGSLVAVVGVLILINKLDRDTLDLNKDSEDTFKQNNQVFIKLTHALKTFIL